MRKLLAHDVVVLMNIERHYRHILRKQLLSLKQDLRAHAVIGLCKGAVDDCVVLVAVVAGDVRNAVKVTGLCCLGKVKCGARIILCKGCKGGPSIGGKSLPIYCDNIKVSALVCLVEAVAIERIIVLDIALCAEGLDLYVKSEAVPLLCAVLGDSLIGLVVAGKNSKGLCLSALNKRLCLLEIVGNEIAVRVSEIFSVDLSRARGNKALCGLAEVTISAIA